MKIFESSWRGSRRKIALRVKGQTANRQEPKVMTTPQFTDKVLPAGPDVDGLREGIQPMVKRIGDFFRSDLGVLLIFAAARLVLHVATNGQYGFHRDELQTIDDARHLDWGYVVYPPLTPLLGRLELLLFGSSLIGFRLFAAAAVSAAMVVTGLMAKELGGGRRVQLLAAVAAGISPVSLT